MSDSYTHYALCERDKEVSKYALGFSWVMLLMPWSLKKVFKSQIFLSHPAVSDWGGFGWWHQREECFDDQWQREKLAVTCSLKADPITSSLISVLSAFLTPSASKGNWETLLLVQIQHEIITLHKTNYYKCYNTLNFQKILKNIFNEQFALSFCSTQGQHRMECHTKRDTGTVGLDANISGKPEFRHFWHLC